MDLAISVGRTCKIGSGCVADRVPPKQQHGSCNGKNGQKTKMVSIHEYHSTRTEYHSTRTEQERDVASWVMMMMKTMMLQFFQ